MENKLKLYWLNPKLEVRETDKYEKCGKGTFAKKNIKKGGACSYCWWVYNDIKRRGTATLSSK